jgi:hypothetical protein
MAILFIDGFDLYNGTGTNTGLQSAWTPNWTFNAPSLQTGRFGGQCLQLGNEGNGPSEIEKAVGSSQAAFTVAHAFRVPTVGGLAANTARAIVMLTANGSFANTQLGWRPNPDGSISVYRMTSTTAGTLLGTTATGLLLNNVWHWIDFSGTINTTTGSVVLKVDGVTVLNLSSVNTQGFATVATWDGIIIGTQGTSTTNSQLCAFDDLYVLDSATTLGERRIETIRPSADTAQKDWTPNTGTVNFNRVNDATVQSGTFVQSSTLNNLDLYDTVDLTGIPVSIDMVQITAFAQKTDAGARSIKLVADVSGTQLLSSDLSLMASISPFKFAMLTKPGGGAWDTSSVNGLKIGPKVSV